MKRCVVDASVVAAALFMEEHADKAELLLSFTPELLAPDLIYAEIANVIWKRHRRREIDETEAIELLGDLRPLSLQVTPCAELAATALKLAMLIAQTPYDCLYLTLAIKNECKFVTADKRFWNATKHTSAGANVAWIGDKG